MGFTTKIEGISSQEIQGFTLPELKQGTHNNGVIKPAILEVGERAATSGEIQHMVFPAPNGEKGYWTEARASAQRARARDILNQAGLSVGVPNNLRSGANADGTELYLQFKVVSRKAKATKTAAADLVDPSRVQPVERAAVSQTQPFQPAAV